MAVIFFTVKKIELLLYREKFKIINICEYKHNFKSFTYNKLKIYERGIIINQKNELFCLSRKQDNYKNQSKPNEKGHKKITINKKI